MNEWMTVKAYAKRHDQSEGHVRRLIREEKIKADKFGGRKWKILVRQQEAQTLFNKQAFGICGGPSVRGLYECKALAG